MKDPQTQFVKPSSNFQEILQTIQSTFVWLEVKSYTIFKFLKLAIPLTLGFYDEASDFIYYFRTQFFNQDLKNLCLIFLVLSPLIQWICWFFLISKLKKNIQDKEEKRAQKTMQLLQVGENSNQYDPKHRKKGQIIPSNVPEELTKLLENQKQKQVQAQAEVNLPFQRPFQNKSLFNVLCGDFVELMGKLCREMCDKKMLMIYLEAIPLSLMIVILLEIKLFPFVVFYLMKYKYQIVITDKTKEMILQKKYKKIFKKQFILMLIVILRNQKGYHRMNDFDENEEQNAQLWSNVDPPFFDGLLHDTNTLYMIKLGDITESIFEAFPQALLQYINNNLANEWNIFTITSFAFSCGSIFINSIHILMMIYGKFVDDSTAIVDVYQKKKQRKDYKLNVGEYIHLNDINEIRMLQYLNQQSIDKLENLTLNFSKKPALDKDCMHDIVQGIVALKNLKTLTFEGIDYDYHDIEYTYLIQSISQSSSQIRDIKQKMKPTRNVTFTVGGSAMQALQNSQPKQSVLQASVYQYVTQWKMDLDKYEAYQIQNRIQLFSFVQYAYFKILEKDGFNTVKLNSFLNSQNYFKSIYYLQLEFRLKDKLEEQIMELLSSLYAQHQAYQIILLEFEESLDEDNYISGNLYLKRFSDIKKKELKKQNASQMDDDDENEGEAFKESKKKKQAEQFQLEGDSQIISKNLFKIPASSVEVIIQKQYQSEKDEDFIKNLSKMLIQDADFFADETILISNTPTSSSLFIKYEQVVKCMKLASRKGISDRIHFLISGPVIQENQQKTPLLIELDKDYNMNFALDHSKIPSGPEFIKALQGVVKDVIDKNNVNDEQPPPKIDLIKRQSEMVSSFNTVYLKFIFPIEFDWFNDLLQYYIALLKLNQEDLIKNIKIEFSGSIKLQDSEKQLIFLEQINNFLKILNRNHEKVIIYLKDFYAPPELIQKVGKQIFEQKYYSDNLKEFVINGNISTLNLQQIHSFRESFVNLQTFSLSFNIFQSKDEIIKDYSVNAEAQPLLKEIIEKINPNLEHFILKSYKLPQNDKKDEHVLVNKKFLNQLLDEINRFKNLKTLKLDIKSICSYKKAINSGFFDKLNNVLSNLSSLKILDLNIAKQFKFLLIEFYRQQSDNTDPISENQIITLQKILIEKNLTLLKLKIGKYFIQFTYFNSWILNDNRVQDEFVRQIRLKYKHAEIEQVQDEKLQLLPSMNLGIATKLRMKGKKVKKKYQINFHIAHRQEQYRQLSELIKQQEAERDRQYQEQQQREKLERERIIRLEKEKEQQLQEEKFREQEMEQQKLLSQREKELQLQEQLKKEQQLKEQQLKELQLNEEKIKLQQQTEQIQIQTPNKEELKPNITVADAGIIKINVGDIGLSQPQKQQNNSDDQQFWIQELGQDIIKEDELPPNAFLLKVLPEESRIVKEQKDQMKKLEYEMQ